MSIRKTESRKTGKPRAKKTAPGTPAKITSVIAPFSGSPSSGAPASILLSSDSALTARAFDTLAAAHAVKTRLPLAAIDARGNHLRGALRCASASPAAHRAAFRQALDETLRWGEPCIMCCPCGHALWAVPVMHNHRVLGGLLVSGIPLDHPEPGDNGNDDTGLAAAGTLDQRLLAACTALLDLATRENLTNAALLEQNRLAAERESGRAEALHDLKDRLYDDIRSSYLHEEPALLAAIQRGERTEARGIINRILTAIYARGSGRRSLLKTLALELVVMMARAAVQAGAEPEKILGINYRSLTELSDVDSQEELSRWLCEMLELLIDAIGKPATHPNSVQLARAVAYMEQNFSKNLTRGEVARAAGLSASHFSHLMSERVGASFTDLLLRLRLDNARRLLARSPDTIAQIAAASGFSEQSYFTRVFKKTFSETPLDYRRRLRGLA